MKAKKYFSKILDLRDQLIESQRNLMTALDENEALKQLVTELERDLITMKQFNEFKVGDLVKVTDVEQVYTCYSQILKKFRNHKYQMHWAYKEYPCLLHKFVVRGIEKHCMNDMYDDNKVCMIIEDVITCQIYLIGEAGISKI